MDTDAILVEMLSGLAPLQPVQLPLAVCAGSVLASAVTAARDLPGRALAGRDGYALRAADVAPACGERPVRLEVIGSVAPGQSAATALPAASAFRVMTGAPLPAGADAVLRAEDAHLDETGGGRSAIVISAAVEAGAFVCPAGTEFAAHATALHAGQVLGPPELAVLSALGQTHACVVPRPRVAIVVTGSELDHDQQAGPDGRALHPSNVVLVRAMVEACGAVVDSLRVAPDDVARLEAVMRAALSADILITTGGTGRAVGDLIRKALRGREVRSLWDMKVRGSRPAMFRVLLDESAARAVPHLALPGRPIAAMVGFSLFGEPLLQRLAGASDPRARYLAARLVECPAPPGSRPRFFAVRLHRDHDGWHATPTGDASLYGLAAAAGADGFAMAAEDGRDPPAAGGVMRVLLPPWRSLP